MMNFVVTNASTGQKVQIIPRERKFFGTPAACWQVTRCQQAAGVPKVKAHNAVSD
jgi:hypothetical protein